MYISRIKTRFRNSRRSASVKFTPRIHGTCMPYNKRICYGQLNMQTTKRQILFFDILYNWNFESFNDVKNLAYCNAMSVATNGLLCRKFRFMCKIEKENFQKFKKIKFKAL